MTNEERELIAKFVARVGGAPQAGGFLSGSVPATQPQLPPIDREADTFIAQQFQQYPEARYRITQTAVVQEAALAEAANRIQRLEWELNQTRQAAQQALAQGQGQPQGSKGFFGTLFGGGQQPQQAQQRPGGPWGGAAPGGYQTAAPPPPQYPPNYQPGMFQRGGSGFLGSALTTAAGVAGGMVVGNALMNAFGGGGHGGASPWSSAASDTSALGAAASDPGSVFDNAGFTDPSGGLASPAGFTDPFGGAGGGGTDPGYDTQSSWDGGGFDSSGGGSDFGGGGFDDNT